ncbi:MAG: hypothetical protein ACLFSW_04600 [Halobacteriales archaeon]
MRRLCVAVAVIFTTVFLAASIGPTLFQTGDVDADETLTRVEVDGDGDAVFTLELRTRLDTEEESQAFEEFAAEVDAEPDAAVSNFRNSVEGLANRAENQTGRSMAVSNFSVETRSEPLPVERGVVVYTFDWSGFAESEDGLRIGDVLSGYILGDSDSLVISYPDGYSVDSVSPTPDSSDGEVRWDGPRDFDEDEPRVDVSPDEDGGSDGNGTTDGGEGTDSTDGTEEDEGVPFYVYPAVTVLVLSAAAVVLYRRRSDSEGAHEPVSVDEPSEPQPEPEPEPEPSFEDLPDAERVLRIVGTEDGRMKQKHLVERTGWSEAKVSQVTSRLEDEGEITKLRMGRENIIQLADDEDEKDST